MMLTLTRSAVFSLTVIFTLGVCFADVPFDRFTSAAPLDGEVFQLVNTNSGRCLAVQDGLKVAGANIVQGALPANSAPVEKWRAVRSGDYFKLVNENSGLVLAVPESSQRRGTQIIQWVDLGSADQQWEFVKIGNHYSLKSRASGLVLGVSESRREDQAPVIQWNLAEIPDQVWFVQWVPGLGKK